MAKTSSKVAAREAARRRKEQADADRKKRDEIELDAATEFELARQQRDAAERTMSEQLRKLDEFPDIRMDRIQELLGVSPSEVRRLRRLLAEDEASTAPESSTAQPNDTFDTDASSDVSPDEQSYVDAATTPTS